MNASPTLPAPPDDRPPVIIVTDRALLKAARPPQADIDDEPGIEDGDRVSFEATPRDRFPHEQARDQRVPFAQSRIAGFEIPQEFAVSRFKQDMFRLACHEVGHGLANLLFAGRVDAIVLSEVDGGGCGRSFGWGGHGMDGARVSLAGLAAERLIPGDPLPIEGFRSDVEAAKNDLRDASISERYMDSKLQEVYLQVQVLFAKNWTRAIVEAATALTRRGVIDGHTLFRILSNAQEAADEAGRATFAKSIQDVQIGAGKGAHHIDRVIFGDPLERLNAEFFGIAKGNARADVADLHKAIGQPGISAHEVARREALRNRADTRAAGMKLQPLNRP